MYNVWTHQLGTHDGLLQVLSSTGQSTQCSPKGCNRYRKRERERDREREAKKEIKKFSDFIPLSLSVPREYQDLTVKGPSSSSKVDFKFGVKRRRRSPLPQKSKHSLVMGGVGGGGDGEAGSVVDAGESVDEFYNEGSDSPPEKRKKRKHEGIIITQ